MNYFLFFTLLPCILTAEVQNAVCVDGTQCPQGKYCCEFGCCDLSKEMQDKGYVPALPPSAPFNASVLMGEPKSEFMHGDCFGTQCRQYCHPRIHSATCCNNPRFACLSLTKCCSNSYDEQTWCCRQSQSCSSIRNLCRSSAVTISTGMMSVFVSIIGMASKYIL